MDAADVTALTNAFDATSLTGTFIAMAPYILGVVGVVIGIGLIKWGVRTVRKKLSAGAA